MKLIVGLGNPGKTYANTRHNVGWWVVDALASQYGFGAWQKKFQGETCKGRVGEHDVVLLKPHTFMNLSGSSVRAAVDFYKIDVADVWVVHDDLDLKPLVVKTKQGGGDAGHNGLKDITRVLTNNYHRLRLGIGRPELKEQVSDYVLHPFGKDEAEKFAALCVELAKGFGERFG
ncbi:MAG: aminoacyl-tRNA hydrolase [Alphaproteobacteria bacterium]